MANIGAFDATQVAPSQVLDPLPPGDYKAMVVASEVLPTSNNDGHYLKLEWQVLEGQYANRKVFQNLNLDNPSTQAVEIAQRQLSSICHAVGKLKVQDSQELHTLPCILRLKIKPAEGAYTAKNEVVGAKSLSEVAAGTSSAPVAPTAGRPQAQQSQPIAQQQQTPAPVATGPKPPPWARK